MLCNGFNEYRLLLKKRNEENYLTDIYSMISLTEVYLFLVVVIICRDSILFTSTMSTVVFVSARTLCGQLAHYSIQTVAIF